MSKNDIKVPMFYLGSEMRTSQKTQKNYMLAKFQIDKKEKPEVVSFYVPATDQQNEVSTLQRFKKYEVILTLSTFNEKPQIDFVGIGGEVSA